MTFADKLKKFKSERVGFKVETEEIAKGLCEVFQMEGMYHRDSKEPMSLKVFRNRFGDSTVCTNNYHKIGEGISIGQMYCTGKGLSDVFPITSQELQRYLKIRKGIQENSEVYFPTPTREIYDELMNTLDSLGCRWSGGRSLEVSRDEGFEDRTIIIVRNKRVTFVCSTSGAKAIISLTSEPPTPSQTITIESDGHHKVTAESNGITAEVTCEPFSTTKGTHMALQQLLEKQKKVEEKSKFNKGGIVEVIVGGLDGTPSATTGLQGKVMQTSIFPEVLFPITIGARNFWAFHQDILKLIRRNPCK